MPENYDIFSTIDAVQWPEYVSARELEGEALLKAEQILDMALVTLETYDGPRYIVDKVNKATRRCIYLYEINADLIDAYDEVHVCNIVILYEPWMKANCIAQASLDFVDDEANSSIVVRRREHVPYYKNDEVFSEGENAHDRSFIPRRVSQHTAV